MKTFLAEHPDELVDQLPSEPGVYLLKDESGRTIYVGKSSNIRNRVKSHLASGRSSPVALVHNVEYIATESELEALILECNLIKRLRPLHNARLKDDKSYPYIKISTQEDYPAVYVTRTVKDDDAVYMGPYADVGSARKAIRILREVFPIRRCRRRMDRPSRPCLDYHIRRCSGPCKGEDDGERYAKDVQGMIGALQGKRQEVIDDLRESMQSASREQNYERAAVLRDRLEALERTTLRQRLSSRSYGNADILGLSVRNDYACVQILFMRDGAIIDQEHFLLESADSSRPELMASFVKEYYSNNPVPPRILVPVLFDDLKVIASWLGMRAGRKVDVVEPFERDERRLVSMADRNAQLMLNLERRMMGDSLKKGLQELARKLDLTYLPRVIEAFDMSSTSGKGAVGSMVRFRWGRPNRSLYRKFGIRAASGRDDYAMMREVITRRFKAALHREEKLPDLVLVDGGPGQASAGDEALRSLGLSIPVVGLAKRHEKIYRPGSQRAITMGRKSACHMLLRRIRDEAHRFAISYHRAVREKEVTKSSLDSIRGVGPKRKAILLERFGSVERILRSDVEEIAMVPGITEELARSILDDLRGRRRARVD